MTTLKPGDLVLVTRYASVQFAQPILFRLIRVLPYVTYDGWAWLDGYEIDQTSRIAVARREIFVQPGNLRPVADRSSAARPMNAGPVSGPRRSPASRSTPIHRMSS